MKNVSNYLLIALAAIIGYSIASCGNSGGSTHEHQWYWLVTTPATETAESVETETCAICAATGSTRPIDKLPFTSIANLDN